ncbi:MAG: thiamine diphosphokinase [candidate division Zixibacteria bacterium]|nr:thiamine diphosphokinase [candidate division Zixibacteria bacterium]MDH3936557.1 thiamine diphosphokinase [candidate division Zixibacteria bacterium]MDH4034579.1 thiamine diphosphokinase [candidate division Zixibacteria bacterium]
MKRWVLFLPGLYRKKQIGFYRKLCGAARLVAVDGGCRFFAASGLTPSLIIGDLDSVKSIPTQFRDKAELLRFPVNKDKSDLQLAFEHCLAQKARQIDIVNPSIGQVDHFLGNLMLLGLFNKRLKSSGDVRVRIVNVDYEILWLHDTKRSIVNCVGDGLSVLPMSASIKLSCRGTEYPAERLRVRRGHTQSLRNRITAKRASIGVEGEALVVHYFSKRR